MSEILARGGAIPYHARRVLPSLNRFLKSRCPWLHHGIRRVVRWWFIESRRSLDDCPAVPRTIAGERLWMHPRFLADPLDVETDVLLRFRDLIRPGATVLDVGGYVGLHAIYAARLAGPTGRVVSFEPSPANFPYLAYHCRKNAPQTAEACSQLVSDTAGQRVPFHLLNDGDSSSNSITFTQLDAPTRTIEVESTTLDDFCAARGLKPDFIKIDVEGAELHVLRGAARVLRECRPVLIVALHPAWLPAGTQPEDVRTFVESAGYDWRALDGSESRELALAEYLCRPL